MKTAFSDEGDFERALITVLFDKGWSHEVKYPSEKDLIRNWADILYRNNCTVDRLDKYPLTDSEMGQILDQIKVLGSPCALNGSINGKTISIVRDNPKDKAHLGKSIPLKIYDRNEIAGGTSVCQIAEQPRFTPRNKMFPARRGDFMLLINGMPVIHAELKRSKVDVIQAAYQIQNYSHEGVFRGLFSLVQVFVAMTPEETKRPCTSRIRVTVCRLIRNGSSIGRTAITSRSTTGRRSRSICCRFPWRIR